MEPNKQIPTDPHREWPESVKLRLNKGALWEGVLHKEVGKHGSGNDPERADLENGWLSLLESSRDMALMEKSLRQSLFAEGQAGWNMAEWRSDSGWHSAEEKEIILKSTNSTQTCINLVTCWVSCKPHADLLFPLQMVSRI